MFSSLLVLDSGEHVKNSTIYTEDHLRKVTGTAQASRAGWPGISLLSRDENRKDYPPCFGYGCLSYGTGRLKVMTRKTAIWSRVTG
jgi:hypothetical protein